MKALQELRYNEYFLLTLQLSLLKILVIIPKRIIKIGASNCTNT